MAMRLFSWMKKKPAKGAETQVEFQEVANAPAAAPAKKAPAKAAKKAPAKPAKKAAKKAPKKAAAKKR